MKFRIETIDLSYYTDVYYNSSGKVFLCWGAPRKYFDVDAPKIRLSVSQAAFKGSKRFKFKFTDIHIRYNFRNELTLEGDLFWRILYFPFTKWLLDNSFVSRDGSIVNLYVKIEAIQ